MTSEIQWIRDVPSDPMMTTQWKRTAIPWCTIHDNIAGTTENGCKGFTKWDVKSGYDCMISTGGPDHKWWKDD